MNMDPEKMVVTVLDLARQIPDALSEIVKECRADGLTDAVLDKMLDGTSARCSIVIEAYERALHAP
jgi:hypothetical protein